MLPLVPRYGFNFLWMFSKGQVSRPLQADERALDFLAHFGFDFVRIPTDYRLWTNGFDYFHPDESVFEYLDRYHSAMKARGIHMSLNVHRGPGYCINGNNLEKHNLWTDEVAQDAFVFLWETFAKRYKGVSNDEISFDLINEPPNVGQYGFTRDIHQKVIRRTVAAIRAIDPGREIVIDGLAGGHLAMPELADLGVVHSGRGYQPMPISHHNARWWSGYESAPEAMYPCVEWEGRVWDRQAIVDFYQPWRDIQAKGVKIHIGEFGCHNETPNDVALRWLCDLFSVFKEFGWGYAMWNFAGPFGIVEHGRPDTTYEDVLGYKVDRALLDLMLENRVS